MASFSASIVTKHEEGATFVVGSWLFTAGRNGDLHRELRSSTNPATPPPARIMPRLPSGKPESDMISASYPTRRSTWRPKRSPTPTREDTGGNVIHQDSQTGRHQAWLPTGLRIVSFMDQGVETRIVEDGHQLEQGPTSLNRLRYRVGCMNTITTYQQLLQP